jgi:hypothetical protein
MSAFGGKADITRRGDHDDCLWPPRPDAGQRTKSLSAESDLAVAEGNVALGLVAIYRALWWQMADTGRQFLCDCRNERANAGAIKPERPIA